MKFIDEVTVHVAGGDGGAGAVSWRREKFEPRGGPDGGDGGNGGAVIFVADPGLNTLIDFAYHPHIVADPGENGGSNQRHGADGADAVRQVPLGTQVYFDETLVADLSVTNARWVAARGGRGGKGNAFFKSATQQAPTHAQPGCAGERFSFRLILKSVADVGLVGLPNVGKSTLVATVTQALPKIADYPFTTLRPSLGVASAADGRRFVLADIPGLVPGAHEGKGLGLKFLQHIERTKTLAHLLDVTTAPDGGSLLDSEHLQSDDAVAKLVFEQFELIDRELQLFSTELAQRRRLIVFTKGDLPANRRAHELTHAAFEARGYQTVLISSATGDGLDSLKELLLEQIATGR
ncbi:MAG: GTPase ObgE [Bdellovibrionales bacterium]|nr:GTPase ObgE [Bdellovibrionales bacterium]